MPLRLGRFNKIYPSNRAYQNLEYLLNFSLLPQKGEQVILPKSNQKRLFSYTFSYSYIPLITWTPNIPILDWTVQCTPYCTLYTVLYSVQCTVTRRQSGWLSWQILWGLTSSLLPVNYNLHYTVHCTEHVTAQCTVHYIGHCTVHCTVHCALHYTLQRHKKRYWKNTVNWTKQCTVILSQYPSV